MRTITVRDTAVLNIHDEGEALSDHIARNETFFEIEILDYLAKNYPDHETILDVGANIGNHTVYFANFLNAKTIVAFEPVPENYKLLDLNTWKFPNVRIRREAVGEFNGEVRMSLNRGNMGACEISSTGDLRVHQVRIDDLFVKPVTLIKIDVEWYEPKVLLGAKNIIATDQPLILIEDTEIKYKELLPKNYHLVEGWAEHRTFLYGP